MMLRSLGQLCGWVSARPIQAGLTVLCATLLAAVVTGCSQTRTVTVPAQEPSVRTTTPDTIEMPELPAPPPRGSVTMPEEVLIYPDTSRPTFEVSLIEVDRTDPDAQKVRIRVQEGATTIERQLALPAVGEGLRVEAGDTSATGTPSLSDLQQTVFGAPTDYEVDARVGTIERPWWMKTWVYFRIVMGVLFGIGLGYILTKIIPGL